VCSACLPGELVADHLDVDSLAHVVPDAAHEVLVDPGLELTHPAFCQNHPTNSDIKQRVAITVKRRVTRGHVGTHQRVVLPAPWP
jgi:hypothetical protein